MNRGAGLFQGCLPGEAGRPASLPGLLWEGGVNHTLGWATGNTGSGAPSIEAVATNEKTTTTKPNQTKSTGVGKMTHPRGWGIDRRGVLGAFQAPGQEGAG